MEASEALVFLGDAIAVAFLAAIPICFLKGRRNFGWLGVVAFLLGASVRFPLYQYLRGRDALDWFWVWWIIGSAFAIVVIGAALRPAKPNSWWSRRSDRRVRPRPTPR